jgi:hypothetical protein
MKKIVPTVYPRASGKMRNGVVGVMPKSSAGQRVHHSDPFTIRNGHYVGHDGFVVPRNFAEFYERFPDYVAKWVSWHADRFASREDLEDWTNDLLVHLMRLPQDSKYRQLGKGDLVQTFDPVRQYGANAARFWNYINLCLTNKFRSMRSKGMKDALHRPGNLSFNTYTDPDEPQSVSDEYCHSHSEHLREAARTSEEQAHHRARLREFKSFVTQEDSKALPAMEAIYATKTKDAAKWLGVTGKEFGRMLRRLRQLRVCFLNGEPVPKQRTPYKKRAVQTRMFTSRRLAA